MTLRWPPWRSRTHRPVTDHDITLVAQSIAQQMRPRDVNFEGWMHRSESKEAATRAATRPGSAYGWSPWVYLATKRASDLAAEIPLKAEIHEGDSVLEPENGPVQALLDRPSTRLSLMRHKKTIYSWQLLQGDCPMLMGFPGDGTTALNTPPPPEAPTSYDPMPQARPKLNRDTDDVEYFQRATSRGNERIHTRRVLNLAEFSPGSIHEGTGAVEVLGLTTLALEWAMSGYNREGFEHGGAHQRLVQVFKRVIRSDQLKRKLFNELKQKLGRGHAWEPLLADAESEFKMLGTTHRDMEFQAGHDANVLEIVGAIGIPPGHAGILKHANYSNMDVQDRILYTLVIRPLVTLYASMLTHALVPRVLSPVDMMRNPSRRVVVVGDFSEIEALHQNRRAKVDMASTIWDRDGCTRSEYRRALRAAGVPWLDERDSGIDGYKTEVMRPPSEPGAPTPRSAERNGHGSDDRLPARR